MKQTRKLIRSKGRNINKKNKSRKYSRKLRSKAYKGGMQRGGAPAPVPAPAPAAAPAVTRTMYPGSVFGSLGTFYTAAYTIREALNSGSLAANAHVLTQNTDVAACTALRDAINSLYVAFYGDGSGANTISGTGLWQSMLLNTAIPTAPANPIAVAWTG